MVVPTECYSPTVSVKKTLCGVVCENANYSSMCLPFPEAVPFHSILCLDANIKHF